jgi:PAS domain S-box-containing protein
LHKALINICCTFLLILFSSAKHTIAQVDENKIKASLLIYANDFITWPEEDKLDTFRIGVIDNNTAVYEKLVQISAKGTLNGKPIKVSFVTGEDYYNYQCLYLSEGYNSVLKRIYTSTQDFPIVLFTSDSKQEEYTMVNFVFNKKTKTITFTINKENIDRKNFQYSGELLYYGGDLIDIRDLYKATLSELEEQSKLVDALKQQNAEITNIIEVKNKLISALEDSINADSLVLAELNDSIKLARTYIKQQNLDLVKQQRKIINVEDYYESVQEDQRRLINEIESQEAKLRELDKNILTGERKMRQQSDLISEKEQQILQQKRTNYILIFIGGVLALIGISVIRAYTTKRKYNTILEQRVDERTHDLERSKKELESEIEQKKIFEKELIKSEKRYREIFNATTDGILIQRSEDGSLVTSNDSALRILGYTREEMVNINFASFCTEEEGYTYDDAVKKMEYVFANGKDTFEWRAKRKDGSVIWLEVALISTVIDDKNRIISSFRDIDEKKRYSIELDNYRRKLEQMVQERTIDLETANEQLSFANVELQETNHLLAQQKSELEKALLELKETQNMLVQSEKLASLGVFIAGIAHEINNPVNYISSGATALFEMMNDMDKFIDYSKEHSSQLRLDMNRTKEIIEKGIDSTTRIISSLRNYSRTESNDFVSYNVISCLEDALVLLHNTYKYHVKIEKNYSEQINIECIPGKINQVFVNIISNATQAIKENGVISINAKVANKHVVLEFIDNGEGISKENMAKIFDPFFTTKDVDKGTGLGLYIVHGIINQHNGKISYKSNEGQGTTVTVSLPVLKNQPN